MSGIDLTQLLKFHGLNNLLSEVDAEIRNVLKKENKQLTNPAGRFLGDGKKLRASLLLAFADTGKYNRKHAVKLAASIELLHLASLVHDDIIDKSPKRRGVITIFAKEGQNQAIVVGDFLLGKAFALAAEVSSEASGLVGQALIELCDGQSRELADQYNLERGEKSYLKAIEGKTARLFAASCQLGNILSSREIAGAYNFGLNFGMAFQILDDVLDIVGDSVKTGKPAGQDITEGVYTLPLIRALHENTSLLKGSSMHELRKAAEKQTDSAEDEMYRYCRKASGQLNGQANRSLHPIANLPEAYCRQAISLFSKHK